MEAFAAVADLEAGWRKLDSEERNRAEVLLARAAVLLRSKFRNRNVPLNTVGLKEELKIVSCNMVKRQMNSSQETEATSYTATAGSFSEQFTFGQSEDTMFVKRDELRMLGLTDRGRVYCCSYMGKNHART